MPHAAYGEILLFSNGVKGMVQDLKRDEIGCILFGDGERDHPRAALSAAPGRPPVFPWAMPSWAVSSTPWASPIDGSGEIPAEGYRPIENPAPGIIDRQPVNTPMETGLLAIDSMFPIGRGQRELIIGDRQTGKTAIALDTILNQKGKDVVCIYVAIGQKASSVAQLVENLQAPGRYGLYHRASTHPPAPPPPCSISPPTPAAPWASTSCTRAGTF